MADLEEKVPAGAGEDIAPSAWKRYVDDIISVVKRRKGQQLLEYLNAQHGQIKFTMEEETRRWVATIYRYQILHGWIRAGCAPSVS